METGSGWHIPIGLMGLGALFVGLAGALLVEYRRAFFADPRSVMSIEVLLNILKLGGPGYLAMMALVAGVPMLLAGTLFFLLFVGFWVYQGAGDLWRAIGLTLGWG
jgi:hypothetical protein